jgi:Helicase associated domain
MMKKIPLFCAVWLSFPSVLGFLAPNQLVTRNTVTALSPITTPGITSHPTALWLARTKSRLSSSSSHKNRTSNRRTWDENYSLLQEFFDQHGHSDVAMSHGDKKLGNFVKRARLRQGQLSPERVAKLNALNFTWMNAKQKAYDKNWASMLQRLKGFRKEYGHCRVPMSWTIGEDQEKKKLAHWVKNRRKEKRQGILDSARIRELDALGFQWQIKNITSKTNFYLDTNWDQRFDELVQFKEEQGHCEVPITYQENPPLGRWVNKQRNSYLQGHLRPDRRKRLDSIGFKWSFAEDRFQAWLSNFNELKDIAPKRKSKRKRWADHSKMPEVYDWELTQQSLYLKGTLDAEREAMLEEIGYWKSLGLKKPEEGRSGPPTYYDVGS